MSRTLRDLIERFGDDPGAILDYVRDNNIDLSKSDLKHLELMMEGS